MSFRSLCDRTITVRPMVAGAKDARGNTTTVPGVDVPNIRARRQLVTATENITDRDEQARTFAYDVELHNTDGVPVVVTGRDRILDGADVLEVLGAPNVVARRRRPHHIELRAYVVEG